MSKASTMWWRKITHVRVRETVPDSILDRADDIELVDLTPEDLLQRLKDGKVYLPDAAERAQQNYFVPGNLAALRELALRRTAQRVDAQMVDYMRAHAIAGPWEASERLLVAVNARPGAAARGALCPAAGRPAARLLDGGPCRDRRGQSEAERDRVAQALRLAERMGGVAATVPAASEADGVIQFARANNVTHIVIMARARLALAGLSRGRRWRSRSSAAPATSACMSCRQRHRRDDRQRRAGAERAPLEPRAFAGSLLFSAVGAGRGLAAAPDAGGFQCGAGAAGGGAGQRRDLWPVAVAVRLPGLRAGL